MLSILYIGEATIDSLLISIVGLIYRFIAFIFQVFIVLAKTKTIDSAEYSNLIDNFYLILAVVMLFIVAFSILQAMVNPENNKGAENGGKVVKNFVTSVVILVLLPTIFNFAFSFQNAIISQNTIGKLFGENSVFDSSDSEAIANAGNDMANSVWKAFFIPVKCDGKSRNDIEACYESIKGDGIFNSDNLAKTIDDVSTSGNFELYSDYGGSWADGSISFNFILALLAGLYLLYVVLNFCLDLGVRLLKLIFYQIIAPIPVFLRIVPEGKLSKTFGDWVQLTVTCYLEVFIRLFIIYFGIYLISMFRRIMPDIFSDVNGFVWLVANAIMVLSVLVFIKESPKLISELFGVDSSKMSLGLKNKLGAGGLFAVGAAVGGGLTASANRLVSAHKDFKSAEGLKNKAKAAAAGVASFGTGTTSGFFRGLKSGYGAKTFADTRKAAKIAATEVAQAKDARETYKSNHGGNLSGVIKGHAIDAMDNVKAWAGINKYDNLIAEKKVIDDLQGKRKTIDNLIFDMIDGDMKKGKFGEDYGTGIKLEDLHDKQVKWESLKAAGAPDAEIKAAEKAYKDQRKLMLDTLIAKAALSETEFKGLDKKVQADLGKIRTAEIEYLESLKQNVTAGFVQELGPAEIQKLYSGESLNAKDGVFDAVKDNMKIRSTQVETEISKMQREEAAKNDK